MLPLRARPSAAAAGGGGGARGARAVVVAAPLAATRRLARHLPQQQQPFQAAAKRRRTTTAPPPPLPLPPPRAAAASATPDPRDDTNATNPSSELTPSDLAAAEIVPGGGVYPLQETRAMVETAMLAAVTGLAYLLSTLLKLEGSLGYVIPLPVVLSAVRSGALSGWRTCAATAALVVVLLGPLRAVAYCLYHGFLAAALGGMWRAGLPWGVTIPLGALVRVGGQLAYIALSSATLNENLFAVLLANVHALLDQLSAAVGASGAPSPTAVASMIFALLLVNGCCYVFLLHVLYTLILGSMGYADRLPAIPGIVRRFLTAGAPPPPEQTAAAGR